MRNFLPKKNKEPTISDLHPRGISVRNVWLAVISISIAALLIVAILSAFISWRILKDGSLGGVKDGGNNSVELIDEIKLKEAANLIRSRSSALEVNKN